MGYNLHITRSEEWFEENQENPITLEEWYAIVAADPELVLNERGYSVSDTEESNSKPNKGFTDWKKHPKEELTWFDYSEGTIYTKNPDYVTIFKMLELAGQLNSFVIGDDCEKYQMKGNEIIVMKDDGTSSVLEYFEHNPYQYIVPKKPWWRFW